MARGEVSWRWAPLVLVWGVPACFLGGQTGDEATSADPGCATHRPLAFDQTSSQGYSASKLLTDLGGTRTATLTGAEEGFWQSLGVQPAPSLPLPVLVSVTHADGSVFENQCSRYLSIQGVVSLEVGDGLIRRTGVGTLEGTLQSAELTVELAPPAGGDSSPQPVALDARLDPNSLQGELVAGGATTDASRLFASFAGP